MRVLALSLAWALASGCAANYADYDRGMVMGYGVEAQPMGGDIYRVTARLNEMNRPGDLQDFLLLKAAETAHQQGALGFAIIAEVDQSESGAVVLPGAAVSHGVVTTFAPGAVVQSNNPGATITIRLERDGEMTYDAAEVIAAIGPRLRR